MDSYNIFLTGLSVASFGSFGSQRRVILSNSNSDDDNLWLSILKWLPIVGRVKAKPLQWPRWPFFYSVPCSLSSPTPLPLLSQGTGICHSLCLEHSALSLLPRLLRLLPQMSSFGRQTPWPSYLKLKNKTKPKTLTLITPFSLFLLKLFFHYHYVAL